MKSRNAQIEPVAAQIRPVSRHRRKPINLKAKTMTMWKEQGYHVANCETRWGAFTFDMFGFADLFCFNADDKVLIQVGRWADRSAKLAAIRDNGIARAWVAAGGRVVLSLWRYKIKLGKQRRDFECREEDVIMK